MYNVQFQLLAVDYEIDNMLNRRAITVILIHLIPGAMGASLTL